MEHHIDLGLYISVPPEASLIPNAVALSTSEKAGF